MTAILTAQTVVHNLYFVHENDVREFVKGYENRDSATSRGRKAVRDLDAIRYEVVTVDSVAEAEVLEAYEAADAAEEDAAREALTAVDITPVVRDETLQGDTDEMTGTDWPEIETESQRTSRRYVRRAFPRKVRLFLGKDVEVAPFTYGDREVRVITVQRSNTDVEQLGHADKVSIFSHRAGLIGTVAMADAPDTVRAAYTERGLY